MISATEEQFEKLRLFDKLFNAMSVEQVKELSESEQIVARLKGIPESTSILYQLVIDNTSMSSDIMNLRTELTMLRSDFQTLMKLTFKPYEYNAINDAQYLKSRYGIY